MMALRTARSTVDQRQALIKLRLDLQAAFDTLPTRFFASKSQKDSYTEVLQHLELWAGYER
jgi:hypothetical protein